MTIICKKGAQDFHRALSKVFDRMKSVALWSANIRKTGKSPPEKEMNKKTFIY
jgi:hypothetical protein